MSKLLLIGLTIVTVLYVTSLPKSAQQSNAQRNALQQNTPSHSGGTIKGYVVDMEGQPVSGVKVSAMNAEGPGGRLLYDRTDAEGNFSIEGLPPRTYVLHTEKIADRYPNTIWAFYDVGRGGVPKVTIEDGQIIRDIKIQLGPKMTKLVGRVVDASTGSPIKDARMILRRAGNPANYLSVVVNEEGAGFEVIIPPVAIKIEVSAPGYQNYYLEISASRVSSVSDITKELIISLKPK